MNNNQDSVRPFKEHRLTRADFDVASTSHTAAEGVLETCRLSDEVYAIAMAGRRALYPENSQAELEAGMKEFLDSWDRKTSPRILSPPST
jgi:hypothetical protein